MNTAQLQFTKSSSSGHSAFVSDFLFLHILHAVLYSGAQSRLTLRPHALQPARLLCPWVFSRQEYWSGLPCLPPGDLPNPGIESRFPTLQADSSPTEPLGKPMSTGVGSLSLLQGIFPTQESNQGLLHCRRILSQVSYQGSLDILYRTPKVVSKTFQENMSTMHSLKAGVTNLQATDQYLLSDQQQH